MPVIDQSAMLSTQRTVTITPDTRSVNVSSRDTVRFVSGEQSAAWNFQISPHIAVSEVNQTAPPGALPRRATIDVAPNLLYGSGG